MKGLYLTVALLVVATCLQGCSRIPYDRYGIDALEIRGQEALDEEALRVCLASHPREDVTIRFGLSPAPNCGAPPFESGTTKWHLWTWPWTDWPLYDRIVLERDLERVVAWYAARGFYDAQVIEWWVEPEEAMNSDTLDENSLCDRQTDGSGCEVQVVIVVDEGEPTLISELTVDGLDELPADLFDRVAANLPLHVGDRFDESAWETAKVWIASELSENSYAFAEVTGQVVIDRQHREARLQLDVSTGPSCRVGAIRVNGFETGIQEIVVNAARIEPGDPFSDSAMREAQGAIYDLGGFASVNVSADLSGTGPDVPLVIEVRRAQRSRGQVGVGVQSGILENPNTDLAEEVPQWDLHLSAMWEHRNLLGGLRRLRIEERPRLVFPDTFPNAEDPRFGNILSLDFRQPAFLESRTTLRLSTVWDYGPDPFLDIQRHQIDISGTLERYFFRRRLFVTLGAYESIYRIADRDRRDFVGTVIPDNSELTFLRQEMIVDLRDDKLRTQSGIHLSLTTDEAGFFLPSSWDYFRVSGDIHAFVPLFAGVVLVSRFSMGALFINEAVASLDPLSETLGPASARFRGGGGTSNRGFFAGELGDGPEGGSRRWLAGLEVRVPVTHSFFLTLFGDAGDVSREETLRFDHPQISVGLGMRVITLLGPIALDFGWRVPDWQVLAEQDERSPGGRQTNVDLLLFDWPGAINLTIGDSL